MDRYQETFKTWNKVAKTYEDKFMDLDLYHGTYHMFCESIKRSDAEILEIGCGPGNITKQLLTKRPDFRIFGIDIAPNMVTLAKKNNPTAKFDVMDSREINEICEKFDGIICGFCLPYLSPSDCKKLFKDAYDLLAENGLFYLSFVEGDPEHSGFQTGGGGDKIYFYYHSLEGIRAKLIEHDFKEIGVFQFEYKKSESEMEIHVVLMAEKKGKIGIKIWNINSY